MRVRCDYQITIPHVLHLKPTCSERQLNQLQITPLCIAFPSEKNTNIVSTEKTAIFNKEISHSPLSLRSHVVLHDVRKLCYISMYFPMVIPVVLDTSYRYLVSPHVHFPFGSRHPSNIVWKKDKLANISEKTPTIHKAV
jgi:hypothetical protein